jgi:phosphopantetheinyl transferase (holo-ACP synthase)
MQKQTGAIELVLFRTKEGYSKSESESALSSLTNCIQNFDGFIKRELASNEDGQWIDLVHWSSKEAAMNAASMIMKDPKALKAFEVIEQEQMQMFHFEPLQEFVNP